NHLSVAAMSRVWHQGGETELSGRTAGELVGALAHEVPVMGRLPFDRVRNGQVCGRIARALLLVPSQEGRVVAFVAPAEDKRMHVALQLAPDVEETGALRRAQPLVTVARVEVRVELPQVQRQMAGHVRAVDHADDAAFAGPAAQLP